MEPAEAESARESHALAFRIALAAAFGLTLGEVLGWDFPFLPAMLAVQLLSGRDSLSVKKGVAVIAVMAAACAFAVLISQIFVDSPLVLLLAGSTAVRAAIAELAETDLRGRLASLAANAAHEEPATDPLSDGPPASDTLEGDAP